MARKRKVLDQYKRELAEIRAVASFPKRFPLKGKHASANKAQITIYHRKLFGGTYKDSDGHTHIVKAMYLPGAVTFKPEDPEAKAFVQRITGTENFDRFHTFSIPGSRQGDKVSWVDGELRIEDRARRKHFVPFDLDQMLAQGTDGPEANVHVQGYVQLAYRQIGPAPKGYRRIVKVSTGDYEWGGGIGDEKKGVTFFPEETSPTKVGFEMYKALIAPQYGTPAAERPSMQHPTHQPENWLNGFVVYDYKLPPSKPKKPKTKKDKKSSAGQSPRSIAKQTHSKSGVSRRRSSGSSTRRKKASSTSKKRKR